MLDLSGVIVVTTGVFPALSKSRQASLLPLLEKIRGRCPRTERTSFIGQFALPSGIGLGT